MNISRQLLDELVAHVLEDPRNEVCGVVAIEADGSAPGAAHAVRVHRAVNIHASPLKFEIDPKELLELSNTIEDHGWEIGAIYHSHVRSRPYPSQTDINLAFYPEALYVIVGLNGEEADVRAFAIRDGQVSEAELVVE